MHVKSELRLPARVAPYLDAIHEKRAAGWTWNNILAALGWENCTPRAIAQAVKHCRWAVEQLPLPAAPHSPSTPPPQDKATEQFIRPLAPSTRINLDDPANQL